MTRKHLSMASYGTLAFPVPMAHLTDTQRQTLPAGILRMAARTQRPDDCMALFYLTRSAGHSIASAARDLDVPYRTAVNWSKAFEDVEDQVQAASSINETLDELSASDVVRERRRLFAEAKAHGKLDLQQRLLADESKRHGLEVHRVEQTSVVVQLQQLAPDARVAEIAERMQRLGLASDPGGSPPAGTRPPLLDPIKPQPKISRNDANALPPSNGGTGEFGQGDGLRALTPSVASTTSDPVQGAVDSDDSDASSVSDTSDTAAQESE